MYKVFVKLLCHRLSPRLLAQQSSNQHGFTLGIRVEDALMTAEVVIEHSIEFHTSVWLLSMDLRKAFDTVDHDALLRALHDRGVDEGYLALLDLLYGDQVGSVHDSRKFPIERGVKQGDILSPILFNYVLAIAFA